MIKKSRVVGFINALSGGIHFVFISMLEVLTENQHKGIVSSLFKMMLKLLEGIACIDLTCDIQMQGFYEQFGMLKSHGMIFRRYLKED